MVNITHAQAIAFVNSLVGWEDLSEANGKPKSPHALTHLEAVLGAGNVPNRWDAFSKKEALAFISYLEAVVVKLRELYPEEA